MNISQHKNLLSKYASDDDGLLDIEELLYGYEGAIQGLEATHQAWQSSVKLAEFKEGVTKRLQEELVRMAKLIRDLDNQRQQLRETSVILAEQLGKEMGVRDDEAGSLPNYDLASDIVRHSPDAPEEDAD